MKIDNAGVIIPEGFLGLLYEDGAFVRSLPPGRHMFKQRFFRQISRDIQLVDMRERALTIEGQEILTSDKVTIQVSLLVYFRVLDAEKAMHSVSAYEKRIVEDVQLAARRFLANRNLDSILSDRNEISDNIRLAVSETAANYGIDITWADVKDLAFPENLLEIMNQILEAERRAEVRLVEAWKDAEAEQVRSQANHEATLQKLEAERTQYRVAAEAEQERVKIHLQTEIEQARVIAEHPILLKLRQIEALQEMAKGGGKFVIGLKDEQLSSVFEGDM